MQLYVHTGSHIMASYVQYMQSSRERTLFHTAKRWNYTKTLLFLRKTWKHASFGKAT